MKPNLKYLYDSKKEGNVSNSRSEIRKKQQILNDIKCNSSTEYCLIVKHLTRDELDFLKKYYDSWYNLHKSLTITYILQTFVSWEVLTHGRKEAIERKIKIEKLNI